MFSSVNKLCMPLTSNWLHLSTVTWRGQVTQWSAGCPLSSASDANVVTSPSPVKSRDLGDVFRCHSGQMTFLVERRRARTWTPGDPADIRRRMNCIADACASDKTLSKEGKHVLFICQTATQFLVAATAQMWDMSSARYAEGRNPEMAHLLQMQQR